MKMRENKNKGVGIIAVAVAITIVMFLGGNTAIAAQTTATVSIGNASAAPGETTTTTVMANNVTDLATFDINVSYDPSVVNVTSAENNPELGMNMNNLEHAGDGWVRLVNFNIVSAGGGLSGNVLISTLTLEAVGDAGDESTLTIAINTLSNSTEGAIPASSVNGTFTVSAEEDITPPETTITAGPTGIIDYNDVTFSWTGTDDVTPTAQLVYSYKLDGSWSAWTSATSKSYTDLSNGNYTFRVKAKDLADNEDPTPAERAFTVFVPPVHVYTNVSIGNASAAPGETTTTTVMANNVTDLAIFDINVSYDPSVVSVTGATNNPDLGTNLNNLEHAGDGWVRLANFNIVPEGGGLSDNVLISTLTLEAVGDADNESTLTITINTLSNSTEGDIPATAVNGIFTVGLVLKGDINGDDLVNLNDATYLAKHVLGWEGYEVIYANDDINGDGLKNLNDATYLAKHVLGWEGYEEIDC